jgi:lysozyme family protein
MASKSKVALGGGAALAASIAVILGGIYEDEGGYVNHKADRGGETMRGVTAGVAREAGYLGPMRDLPKECSGQAPVCSDKIYTDRYMRDPGFLPLIEADPAVGEELVNTAVNTGPARPSRWLQQSLNGLCGSGLSVDGKVGGATHRAFRSCQAKVGAVSFCLTMLDRLDGMQSAFYDGLVRANPSQRVFLKGWKAHRIGNVDRKKCGAQGA